MSPYLALAMIGVFALVVGAVVFGGTTLAYALERRATQAQQAASDRLADTEASEPREPAQRRAA